MKFYPNTKAASPRGKANKKLLMAHSVGLKYGKDSNSNNVPEWIWHGLYFPKFLEGYEKGRSIQKTERLLLNGTGTRTTSP